MDADGFTEPSPDETPRVLSDALADRDGRADAMEDLIDAWLSDLVDLTDEARASEHFQEWLDVQSRFHDYSFRNTLLILAQCPDATRVAGYRAWQEEFDRHVQEGESAIWIWAPIVTDRCPGCGNGQSYHETADCDDDTPVEAWERGVVGFRPVPVFDVSQTAGEPLPDLETEAYGDGAALVERVLAVAPELGIDATLVAPEDWSHGSARGVCRTGRDDDPTVAVRKGPNDADVASTFLHEFAHALLHDSAWADADLDRGQREVEAESVAYVVGRYAGLDMGNSGRYVAHWEAADRAVLRDQLERISRTAQTLIAAIQERSDAA